MASSGFSSLPLAYAWRSLRRAPVFTVAASLTLALGVGAVTAIFSVVNAVLIRPLPYPESERLVGMGHAAPGINMGEVGQSLGTYFTYRRIGTAFEESGAYSIESLSLSDPVGAASPERLRVATITPTVLPLLRAAPLRGRVFTEDEGRPNGAAVVILAEDFWRRRFGADPSLLGRPVQLDGRSVEVVGIMPATFRFPDARTQAWTPLVLDPTTNMGGGFNWQGIGRLRRGTTVASAQADAERGFARVPEFYPFLAPGLPMEGVMKSARLTPSVRPLRDDVIGPFAQVLWVVSATAGLVLLLACANVANLLLVRAEGRQKELTVRAALGAGRGRVLAYFFAESMVLAAIGGALGVVLAVTGVALLVRHGPTELPRLAEVSVDGTALVFALLAATLASLAATLIPAWRQGAVNLGAMLREGGRSGTAGRQRQQTRGVLVAAQVALAMVLLSGSGLLARSVMRLRAVRPGFDYSQVLSFRLELPRATYKDNAAMVRFDTELLARLGALPGVSAVGATSKLPLLIEGANLNPIVRDDRPPSPDALPPLATLVRVSDTYFRAMGIPLVVGRTFNGMSDAQTPFEVIVSRKVATDLWGDSTGTAALGQRLRALNGSRYTIIGVVETVLDTSLASPPNSQVYFPITPQADTDADRDLHGFSSLTFVVRAPGDPLARAPVVRRTVEELDRSLPVFNLRAMDEVVAVSYARLTFTLLVLAVAAGAALVLGAVGLYGVVAYVVTLRTKEIGVRIALGAQPRSVGRGVARQGVLLALAGAGVGLLAFALLAGTLRVFLFGVAPMDPVTLLGVTTILVLVAGGASWIPARRAARINPVEAMRADNA
ncbi:MAG: ABC transporter permease [Gemmatimonadaceae bacterium]